MQRAQELSGGAEEYLSWLAVERGRSRHTLSAYRSDLAAYEGFLGRRHRSPSVATEDDVVAFLGELRAQGCSTASVARALSAVRGLYRFLEDERVLSADPTADVQPGSLPRRLPKALSEDAVVRLLAAVRGNRPLDRRDRALLEMLYGSGARISEVVGLDLADLATGDGMVRVHGKGSKERLVPIGRCATQALAAWLAPGGRPDLEPRRWRRRGDADALFLNARGGRLTRQGAFGIVRGHAARAGLGTMVSPHVLRHSCATHMLGRGADIRFVQELLGHVSIGTTQLYTKVSPEHLRAAYEAAHPRAGQAAKAGHVTGPHPRADQRAPGGALNGPGTL